MCLAGSVPGGAPTESFEDERSTSYDLDEDVQAVNEAAKRETIESIRRMIGQDVKNDLAKIDDGLKERVDSFIEQVFRANGGENRPLQDKSIQEGIVMALEQRGIDLTAIKTREEFDRHYDGILQDCHDAADEVKAAFADLRLSDVKSDPTVMQWTRSMEICARLADQPKPYGNGAYRMLVAKFC